MGIDVDVDTNIDSDMAVSMNWGSFRRGFRPALKGFWG